MFKRYAAHLTQEVDAPAHDEGRDGRADHGEESDGADVLEEVPLNIHEHTGVSSPGELCHRVTQHRWRRTDL